MQGQREQGQKEDGGEGSDCLQMQVDDGQKDQGQREQSEGGLSQQEEEGGEGSGCLMEMGEGCQCRQLG